MFALWGRDGYTSQAWFLKTVSLEEMAEQIARYKQTWYSVEVRNVSMAV